MRINIKVQEGYEVEDVLEKALKTVRKEQEGVLRDPYLLELYNYSNNLFNTIMEAMNDEIMGILNGNVQKSYSSKPLGTIRVKRIPQALIKSKQGKTLVPVQVKGKHGTYQSHRWKTMGEALTELNQALQRQGVENPGKVEFVRKVKGSRVDRKGLINQYNQTKSDKPLFDFIKDEYEIDDVGAKEKKQVKKPYKPTTEDLRTLNKLLQLSKVDVKGLQFQRKGSDKTLDRTEVIKDIKSNPDNDIETALLRDYKFLDGEGNEIEPVEIDNTPVKYEDHPITDKRDWSKLTFRDSKRLKSHFTKHQEEFDNITTEQEYLQIGIDLMQMPENSDIIGIQNGNEICKYDKANNTFISIRDGLVLTIMKPKRGLEYFERQWREKVKS